MDAPLIHNDHPPSDSLRWGHFWLRKWIELIRCRQLGVAKWHFLAQTYLVLGTVYNIKLSKYFKTDNRQEPLNNLGISRGSYYLSHPLLGP